MVGRSSFPANCGDATPARLPFGVDRRKREWFSDGAKYDLAIPAVPLRSVPDKDYDKGLKLANATGDTVHKKDELLKRESDKLAALISEANEFMNLLDARNPRSMDHQSPTLESDAFNPRTSVGEQKLMMETDDVLATSVMPQNFDRNLYGKRLKVNGETFLFVREENASGTVTARKDNAKPLIGMLDKNIEFDKTCPNIIESQQTNIDLVSDLNERDEDDALKMICVDGESIATNSNDEAEYCENDQELTNLEIVQNDHPQRLKVMQALQQFKEEYELEIREGRNSKYPHFEAAKSVKAKGINISTKKPFGHIPGINIGDRFSFRAELTVVGLNRQFTPGIDFVILHGKQYATCIVNSGRYENEIKQDNVLIYYGEGADQKLARGNIALVNSMEMGYPVRVIHKTKSKSLGVSNNHHGYKYVYDGLYSINRFWQDRENQTSKLVFKFELQRLPGQPSIHDTNVELEKENFEVSTHSTEICVLDDLSQGKEKFKVRVMNGVDEDLPPPFNYITSIVYPPHWFQWCVLTGCDCINGCSDTVQCPCIAKNGGEIPFNEKGLLTRARTKNVVHECGPSCKCPPSCMNRVSQHGPRFQLEIFKTKSTGWGVRSRDYIAAGSFICEYVGELVGEKEASQRIGNDEYLFDISHGKSKRNEFALDAAKYGNVGRFINHSCDPNVFAQKVVFDDDDERVPHIMLFSGKRIPVGTELRYDYNYSKMRVCDANGNIKMKPCYCGSRKCSGRLY